MLHFLCNKLEGVQYVDGAVQELEIMLKVLYSRPESMLEELITAS
jgi:hypothetical protein